MAAAEVFSSNLMREGYRLVFAEAVERKDSDMRIIFKVFIPIWLCLLAGCRENAPIAELPPEVGEEVEFTLEGEGLKGLPGPVYRTQGDSAIHWQPWEAESFEKAARSQRLIFAVVVMPQQPSYEDKLAYMEGNAELVSAINGNYVPILIDGDAIREMGLLKIQLCAEIRSGFNVPLMIWMTPEGAPVAYMPMGSDNGKDIGQLFSQSHEGESKMWQEDKAYVLSNSISDQQIRRQKLLDMYGLIEKVDDPAAVARRCLRQLSSLYDPLSRSLDETGGLFPTGALNLLAAGVLTEALPETQRKMSKDVLVSLLDDLLRSAMFDPLDGGVFEYRIGSDWSMPGFFRTCSGQARVAVSLFESYAATGDERALSRGLDLIKFAEENYQTEEGLYVNEMYDRNSTKDWLWEFGEIRDLLSEEEFPVFWIAAGLAENGNILPENNPGKSFFRKNTLLNAKTNGEVASMLGVTEDKVAALMVSAKGKLLKARDKRLQKANVEMDANASATLRMVSVFATAYRVTGDAAYKDRAVELLGKTERSFSDGRLLRLYQGDAPDSAVGGRAFLYALAILAALDVHAITLDDSWKFRAADLMSTATELFFRDGYVNEVAADMDLIGLPLSNNTMNFDESTVGLFTMGANRLGMLGVPLPQSLRDTLGKYPEVVALRPVVHADFGEAGLLEGYGKTYLVGENVSGEVKKAIMRLPLRGAPRKISSEEPDKVLVVDAEGNVSEVNDLADIEVPFLP